MGRPARRWIRGREHRGLGGVPIQVCGSSRRRLRVAGCCCPEVSGLFQLVFDNPGPLVEELDGVKCPWTPFYLLSTLW